jgi:hypothetical protein
LPASAEEWLVGDENSLAFKRCAYWENLFGRPAVENTTKIRLRLPRTQMFHPEMLRELMNRAHLQAAAGRTGF